MNTTRAPGNRTVASPRTHEGRELMRRYTPAHLTSCDTVACAHCCRGYFLWFDGSYTLWCSKRAVWTWPSNNCWQFERDVALSLHLHLTALKDGVL